MFKIRDDRMTIGLELRQVVVSSLQELMLQDEYVVAMEADLGGASGFTKLRATNPDKLIQCGIAEANMTGTAAGLSLMGYKPYLHTFGPFATRRMYDQLFLSGAYAHTTMNIYGSDPGFCAGANGGTHTTWEDVALLRVIPGVVICDGADAVQTSWIVKEFSRHPGIHYLRANRKGVRNLYEEGSTFELGKGNIVKTGKDVLVITAGQLVSDALDCAEALEESGISVEVIDMFCIKPLDVQLILQESQQKKIIVTFENHSVTGGLGSAVAEVIAEYNLSVRFKRHGVHERFGEVGTPEYLQKAFQLTAQDLQETIEALCDMQKQTVL